MAAPSSVPDLGEELTDPSEESIFGEMQQLIQAMMAKNVRPVRRQQHPKHHGCARAEFIVDASVPEHLHTGVFTGGRSFPAWVRFSNSSQQVDTLGNAHGVAIKLLGVSGRRALPSAVDDRTQDFLLVDHPTFFVRTPQDYLELFSHLARAPGKTPWKFFFPGLNPACWRLHELRALNALRGLRIADLLATQYWSMSAYKLGRHAVKYSIRSIDGHRSDIPHGRDASSNYLGNRLAAHLQSRPASFEFLVQVQTDPVSMPVEDPTIVWRAPFQRLAWLQIPRQDVSSPENMALAEHLSFNPWHALEVHRPLGGINRIRRAAYEASSSLRHSLNGVQAGEPRA